jgi:DNA-binding response OmpR family regulator
MENDVNDNSTENNDNGKEIVSKKILYVDDVLYSLVAIKEGIKKYYDVYPAQSVEKMFETLERIQFDLILLDLNMPDFNGFTVLEKLKADNRYKNIPVIFLTSQKDKKSIIKGMSLGAVDFITKPVSAEQLIEQIEFYFDYDKRAAIKPIILAVDDAPSTLHAITTMLGEQYTLYTLPGVGVEQVLKEILQKITPDLFLLDYNMPGLTGFDLVPLIRKTPGHEDTPIVFLTSEKTMDHITVAVGLGASDYIIKPIDETILHKKLKASLKNFYVLRRIRTITDERRN